MQIPSPKMAAVRAILAFVLLLLAPSLARAQTNVYQYNSSFDEIGSITVPGTVTSLTYDTGGGSQTGLVADSESGGITTRYYYDTNNDLTQSYTEPSTVTSSAYDPVGNDVVTGDGNGLVFQYKYDDSPYEPPIDAVGRITSVVYDPQGELLVVGTEDPLGHATETYYDPNGSVVGSFTPLGSVTAVTYDGVGRDLVVAADINGQNTISVYDGSGNVLETFNTTYPVTSLAYDPGSNDLIAASESRPNITVYLPNQSVGPQDGISYGPSFSQIPTPGPPTIIIYDPTNKVLFVVVTPESSSLVLIAPAFLLLLGMAILRTRRVNEK